MEAPLREVAPVIAWIVVLALVVLVAGVVWWARRPGASRPDDELSRRSRRSGGWAGL